MNRNQYLMGFALVALLLMLVQGTHARASTGDSTAQVTFTQPEEVFAIELSAPGGQSNAMDVDFTGVLPMLRSDKYAYMPGSNDPADRWIKITATAPLVNWNVSASMSSFYALSDGEQTPIFDARLTATDRLSYRQVNSEINNEGDGLSVGTDGWTAAPLTSGHFVLTSDGVPVPLTDNKIDANMGRGFYYIQFLASGIALDHIVAAEGQQVQSQTSYAATITWTGSPVANN